MLPDDMWFEIFQWLGISDLIQICTSCKKFWYIMKHYRVLERVSKRELSQDLKKWSLEYKIQDYKLLYMYFKREYKKEGYIQIQDIGILNNRLNLSGNKISKIPDTIGLLVQLQKLNLSINQISEIPDTIGSLVQLQELDLSNNKISKIPDTIGLLVQLQELYLSSNKISEIPDTIGSLVQLQELYLSNNKISKIPNTIGSLAQLQKLNLFNNQISKIPDIIKQLIPHCDIII